MIITIGNRFAITIPIVIIRIHINQIIIGIIESNLVLHICITFHIFRYKIKITFIPPHIAPSVKSIFSRPSTKNLSFCRDVGHCRSIIVEFT